MDLYYTVSVNELRASMPADAILLSAASFYRPRPTIANPLRMPQALYQARSTVRFRGADCGAFTATMRWGGSYRFTPLHYLAWLNVWQPHWAATFDLCCLSPTGGDPGREIVLARQRYSTHMAEFFWYCYRLVNWAWCPTITGYTIADFQQHARVLAPLIRHMYAYYSLYAYNEDADRSSEEEIEQYRAAFRVGLGSLHGRTPTFIAEVIACVQVIIGTDIPLHLWGIKLKTFQSGIELPGVVSCDTGAWNNLFAHEHEKRRASGLSEVQYSWQVSHPAYASKVQHALQKPRQSSLFSSMQPSPPVFPAIGPDAFIEDADAMEIEEGN